MRKKSATFAAHLLSNKKYENKICNAGRRGTDSKNLRLLR